VQREEYSVRRRYLQNVGLSGAHGLTADQTEGHRERAIGDDPIGFWTQGGVEGAVSDGRKFLSGGWEKRKAQ